LPLTQEFDVPFALSAAIANGNGWGISTPLCVYESAISADRIRLLPLPGVHIHRRLSLLAHKRELGNLPAEIAAFSRQILREKCLPAITEIFPWLKDEMTIGVDR
jgi:DNA-binding transcriptional LysR family regulator